MGWRFRKSSASPTVFVSAWRAEKSGGNLTGSMGCAKLDSVARWLEMWTSVAATTADCVKTLCRDR